MGRGLRTLPLVLAALVTAPPAAAQRPGDAPPTEPVGPKLTKPPVLRTTPSAPRPDERPDEEVRVGLALTLDKEGHVQRAQVVESGGTAFDEAALEAAKAFAFEPAEVDGRPAAVRIRYVFTFPPVPPEGADAPAATPSPPAGPGQAGPSASPQKASEAAAPGAASPEAATAEAETAAEIRVQARRAARPSGSVTVRAEEARVLPGTQGDAAKVIEDLPGVARASYGNGAIVAWGSTPRESRIFVDGVEVPVLYHGAGLRSILSTELVGGLRFVPGAFGVEDGRALGGVVHVDTTALDGDRRVVVAADTLDAGAFVRAPVTRDVHVAAAVRGSYVRPLFQGLIPKDAAFAYALPDYGDVQVKTTARLNAHETLDVLYLGSLDGLRRDLPSPDPTRARYQEDSLAFQRAALRYTDTAASGGRATAMVFVGTDASASRGAFGAVPVEVRSQAFRYGVRARYELPLLAFSDLVLGFDAAGTLAENYRAGSLVRPPREGDIAVFGQPPGGEINADRWATHVLDAAPYAAAPVRLGPFTITPGVRAPIVLVDTSRVAPRIGATPPTGGTSLTGAVNPRVLARYQPAAAFAVNASAGVYHLAPDGADLSPVFGNPALGLSRSRQLSVGVEARPFRDWLVEATAYYKLQDGLVARSPLPTPALAQALVQTGQGRSYGAQLLVRKELGRGFFGWVSYTLSRSERRYEGEERYRLFDFDQPHVLAVVASYAVSSWTFSARYRYASGAPRTAVTGAYYEATYDRYEPRFGEHNAIRLPDFHQLDARVEHRFDLGASRLFVYADVQNLTAHQNAEDFVYSHDYAERGIVAGLPTLAVVGARWEL